MDSCGFDGMNVDEGIFEMDGEPRNVEVLDNISFRLKEAANVAIRELESIRAIPSTIEILNQKNTSIVIDEISDSRDPSKKYIVVYGGGQSSAEPLFRDEVGKLRYVYLRNLSDCRVFVKCKLLRIMFHECNKCQVSLRAPVVGMADFFHCKLTNINIRIPDGDIPVTRIESCKDLHIFQSNECLVYLIYMSIDVSGTIIEHSSGARQSNYELGKLFWEDQCQTFICLSRSEGFAAAPMEYVLNDLVHHIIVRPPENKVTVGVSHSREELFGTTPPVNNSDGAWEKYLKDRNR